MTRLPFIAVLVAGSGCHLLIPDDGPSNQSDLSSATAVQLVAGLQHSCALTGEGGVRCWGTNTEGQLGAGTDEELDPDDERDGRYMAMQVLGLETGVAAISGTANTTCALTTAGGVKCWGDGYYGTLGNGSDEPSAVPVDVVGLGADIVAVTAGGGQTCVLTTAGGVTCWGNNTHGECGYDDFYWTLTTPTPVAALPSGVAKVVAGVEHTCALTTAGGAKCWGINEQGQLGNDAGGTAFDQSDVPVDVAGLTAGVDDIHPAGWYSMARVGDAVKRWGAFAIHDVEPTPIDTPAASGVVQLAAGNIHACYIDPEGAVWCWGDNESGAVGYWDKHLGIHEEPEPIRVDSLP